MENNNFKLNYERFDLLHVLEELISDYSIQINKKKIQIKLNFIENPILINADKVRIIEVFDNLLSNSIKFTENGEITISVENLDNMIRITIKDTGMGIEKEYLNQIFSKFFTTDKLGTGLGLYISKIIVLKHSGSIKAQNNDESSGSTFTVILPISP
jgi:signal transduction histidine kinase